jgi:hypothetical protein
MVVVANKGVFGDGVFSMRGGAVSRMVGTKKIDPVLIQVAKPAGTVEYPDKVRRFGISPPFMPKSITEPYHPSGNSLCYGIQTAHLMGAETIYALGFTLQSGSAYFWGDRRNPITKKGSTYDVARALHWLKWYDSQWPGRCQLVEGWSGPVDDVLPKVSLHELRTRFVEVSARSDTERPIQ